MLNRVAKKITRDYFPAHYNFAPEWLVLGVNNVCNLHCKMCDVGTQNLETNFAQNLVGARPLNMPMSLFEKIIDQAKKYYPKVKIGYAFTEPLVYTHLFESLKYADKQGFFTSITTNALNLGRKAEGLIEGNLNELFISLDGLQDTHNEIRGNKKSFQKAIEGIEVIRSKSGRMEISVFCVITEWNYYELFDFLSYMKGLPIKHIGFMHPNFTTKSIANQHNIQYGEHYFATHSNIEETDFQSINLEHLLDNISRIKSEKWPFSTSFSPDISTMESLDVFYKNPSKKIGKLCNDAFSNMMIKSNGEVIPAHGRCYNLTVGNLHEQNLNEIWSSAIYNKFRKDIVGAGGLFPACNRCCSAF